MTSQFRSLRLKIAEARALAGTKRRRAALERTCRRRQIELTENKTAERPAALARRENCGRWLQFGKEGLSKVIGTSG